MRVQHSALLALSSLDCCSLDSLHCFVSLDIYIFAHMILFIFHCNILQVSVFNLDNCNCGISQCHCVHLLARSYGWSKLARSASFRICSHG